MRWHIFRIVIDDQFSALLRKQLQTCVIMPCLGRIIFLGCVDNGRMGGRSTRLLLDMTSRHDFKRFLLYMIPVHDFDT